MRAAILRVLALGEGNASVNVMLLVSEACQEEEGQAGSSSHHALATASTPVHVLLKDNLMTSVQNDARTLGGALQQSYTLPHPPPLSSNQIVGDGDHKRKMTPDPELMIKVYFQLFQL